MNMTELKLEGRHEAHWVTISSDEYESMKATIEALSDPEVRRQLRESNEDIRAGRTVPWSAVVRELKEKRT